MTQVGRQLVDPEFFHSLGMSSSKLTDSLNISFPCSEEPLSVATVQFIIIPRGIPIIQADTE